MKSKIFDNMSWKLVVLLAAIAPLPGSNAAFWDRRPSGPPQEFVIRQAPVVSIEPVPAGQATPFLFSSGNSSVINSTTSSISPSSLSATNTSSSAPMLSSSYTLSSIATTPSISSNSTTISSITSSFLTSSNTAMLSSSSSTGKFPKVMRSSGTRIVNDHFRVRCS
jgi:hypothetical protein